MHQFFVAQFWQLIEQLLAMRNVVAIVIRSCVIVILISVHVRQVVSSKYFGTLKCCHPQISDLVIRLVFFRESSRKIINKLTSRLPSCESSIPGRFALFECNSNDVRICKKISQESCHQEIMKPKSDICGWQHLWGPKDLLNSAN